MSTPDVRRAVAIGGGTGLPTVLGCLLERGLATTAVVTMADDGGSSGALRRDLGVLPPGDIRNCLVALAEPGSELAALFQYRFGGEGGLAGHALGNLALAALADTTGSFADAIDAAGRLLGVRGTVLPSTLTDVRLHGMDADGAPLSGQARIAVSERPVARVFLDPPDPDPHPPVLDAIRSADAVVIGPGSLFTSIVPNFLVAGVADALKGSSATRIYVCNVANQRGETHAMDAADHVDALLAHGLEGAIDVAIVHVPGATPERPGQCVRYDGHDTTPEPVHAGSDVVARIEARGVRVVTADVVDPLDARRHSAHKLCRVVGEVIG